MAVTLIVVTSNTANPVRFEVKLLTIDGNEGCEVTDFTGDVVDPRRWHTVRESTAAGETILTPPLDRPVLYKRGHASEVPSEAQTGVGAGVTHIKPYSKNPSYWEYRASPFC